MEACLTWYHMHEMKHQYTRRSGGGGGGRGRGVLGGVDVELRLCMYLDMILDFARYYLFLMTTCLVLDDISYTCLCTCQLLERTD